jgi:hypothetical protein
MSYNFGEIIKKLYFLVSRSQAKLLPTPSPPPLRKLRRPIFHVVDSNVRFAGVVFTRRIHSQDERGEGGVIWMDHRIKLKFNMKIDNSILLLCYLDKIRLIPTGDFWRVYIVKQGYKREPEPAASPQSATPHSTGNISVNEGSRPQQHTWNSKALFFPAQNYCCT